jgi:transposase InsO family protein
MAKRISSTWQRGISGQWASNTARGGKPPSQTRDRESTKGARHHKKSEHILMVIQMKYQLIRQNKQEFPVVVMCQVLHVSESGYYVWLKRPICQHKREDAQLTKQIRQIFTSHQSRYGSPRFHAELKDQAIRCSRKWVARLMREAGMSAKRTRRRVVTTKREASHPVAAHVLERDFTAPEANKKRVTDIPYIPMAQGWLYLAVILDLYSRIVVGWSMSSCCDEELVERALDMALARRCPSPGLLHHSDRGYQYTSRAYRLRLEQAGVVVSMSRKGNYWDNAVMESFFGSLKQECERYHLSVP